MGEELGRQMADAGLTVKYATTDGDGRSAEGVQNAMRGKDGDCSVMQMADTTHLGKSQSKHAMKAEFSAGMFPGVTAQQPQFQQKTFALDIKNRGHIIFNEMHTKYAGNLKVISTQIPKVIDATVLCYAGDCSKCCRNSVVSSGGKQGNWWKKSLYLQSCPGLSRLNMTWNDRNILVDLLQIKLGGGSLQKIKHNTNTNKNEAINRGISASLPKNVNFSRNAKARAYSAIHRINKGQGKSVISLLNAVGCPIGQSSMVMDTLNQMQHVSEYNRCYYQMRKQKRAKIHRKTSQMRDYYEARRCKGVNLDPYIKGQLDPLPGPNRKINIGVVRMRDVFRNTTHLDHNYVSFASQGGSGHPSP